MKTVGFRKDKDAKIVLERFIDDPESLEITSPDESEKKLLVNYLQNGTNIFAITLYLSDGEIPIGPYTMETDGEWIWPGHFAYYINKNDFSCLSNEFFNYVKDKKFILKSISFEEKRTATIFLEMELLNVKRKG